MKKHFMKKCLVILGLSVFCFSGGITALAVVEQASGGTWDHDVCRRNPFNWHVWSHYHHPTRMHHAWCACGGDHKYGPIVSRWRSVE
ncbi:MAG: lactococcin 972 family bacteriocin [Streptococcaceae bacterium]|jgi:hypothetical protein|nr:lactococcin 972 family bacteriocin [Streptococcaceae bacterium]